MLEFEIKLSDERIASEGKYKLESVYDNLCQIFTDEGFLNKQLADGTWLFASTGDDEDYDNLGKLISTLRNETWFMDYVIKWFWYSSDGKSENDISIEDMLFFYTKKTSER